MPDLLTELLLALAGAFSLLVFYRAVQHKWPEQYGTLRGVLEGYASRSLLRYASFRAGPVYLVAVFLGVTAQRLKLDVGLILLILALLHVGSTNGRAAINLLHGKGLEPRPGMLLLYYAVSSSLISVAVLVSYATYGLWRDLIPVPRDLVTAIWTGLAAAILAAFVQDLQRDRRLSSFEQVTRAQKDLGAELWMKIDAAAGEYRCDPDFLRALVVAEVQQRPAWLRRLERVAGRLHGAGSYGPAQMWSATPIDDSASIRLLAESYANYFPDRTKGGVLQSARFELAVERHNRKQAFVEAVSEIYETFVPSYSPFYSEEAAEDGRRLIEGVDAIRSGSIWTISGTASAGTRLAWRTEGPTASEGTEPVSVRAPGLPRGDWKVMVDVQSDKVWFWPDGEDIGTDENPRQALLDFTNW